MQQVAAKSAFIPLFLPALFLILAWPARAALVGSTSQATLNITPDSGSFAPNENFAASIYLNTHGENVVAVAAYLIYDKAHFQAISIDNSSSAFTMEAEKSIDSASGVVRISFGKPTPGVNSAAGLVAKANFRALSEVAPSSDNFILNFTPGSVMESNAIKDDGLGTDILSGVYNAKYTVSAASVPGDITGDGEVDISDLSLVGLKFGTKSSDPGWNPAADVVPNGEIDIYDLVFVASRFT